MFYTNVVVVINKFLTVTFVVGLSFGKSRVCSVGISLKILVKYFDRYTNLYQL